jgi:flagellin-like protein
MKKKAISPVIATVLLVVVAIALFVIIFFWIKSFQSESIMKQGTSIENVCSRVKFNVQSSGTSLSILNNGDVPIQAFKIIYEDGSAHDLDELLMPGESRTATCSGTTKLIPILRGTKGPMEENFACEAQAKNIACQ